MIRFEKWEGLGNDFIVVDRSELASDVEPAAVQRLCDRRRGIGADGVLVVDRSDAAPAMIVRNADGSRPEMCGNGLRCVLGALLLADGGNTERTLDVRTDAGLLACRVERVSDVEVRAEVEMGRARFLEEPLRVAFEGSERSFARVDMGNPHAITFERYDADAIARLGPVAEHAVASGTNVEFVTITEAILGVRVWERGVGFTEACGTGACAVAAEACRRGLAPHEEWLRVRLPGGDLEVRVERGSFAVRMRGPARRVFSGTTLLAP